MIGHVLKVTVNQEIILWSPLPDVGTLEIILGLSYPYLILYFSLSKN